jgi:hypothetical protein
LAPKQNRTETDANGAAKPRPFAWTDRFNNRHIGPNAAEIKANKGHSSVKTSQPTNFLNVYQDRL